MFSSPPTRRVTDAQAAAAPSGAPFPQGPSSLDFSTLVQEVLGPLIPNGAPVALFDFPNHPNVGDSAIWLGEEAFLGTRTDLRTIVVDSCSIRNSRFPVLPSSAVILIIRGALCVKVDDTEPLSADRLRSVKMGTRGSVAIDADQDL